MTAAIKSSLSNLDAALGKLETSIATVESNKSSPAKAGGDLFSAPRPSNDIDAKALASRLDGAISKVEKLLREGDEAHG